MVEVVGVPAVLVWLSTAVLGRRMTAEEVGESSLIFVAVDGRRQLFLLCTSVFSSGCECCNVARTAIVVLRRKHRTILQDF